MLVFINCLKYREVAANTAFSALMDPGFIRATIARRRLVKAEVAQHLGLSPASFSQLLSGARALKADELPLLIEALGLDQIPICCTIGAGGEVTELAEPEHMRLPFVPAAEQEAFRVVGDHLLPRYADGDVIVAWKAQRRPLASYFGQEAIVTLEGHPKRLLKHLQPIPGASSIVRLVNSFAGRRHLDGRVKHVGEIAGQLRAHQLQLIRPSFYSAVPDPLR